MKKVLALVVALVTAAGISVAVATASSPHGGDLHLKKECSEYTGLADSFCTITASNVKAIKVGSRVVYLQGAGQSSLDSDIVLVVGPGSYALGHVTLDLSTGLGKVTLSGGAGPFTSFHAEVRVTPPGGANGSDWAWDGSTASATTTEVTRSGPATRSPGRTSACRGSGGSARSSSCRARAPARSRSRARG